MSEYISREELLEKEKYLSDWNIDLHYIDSEDVKTIPSADVRPNIHARWEKSEIPNEQYVCSACGGAAWYYDWHGQIAKSKYCPNCGAVMDKPE